MNTKQFDKKIIATFKALVADNFFVNNKFEDIQELDDYILHFNSDKDLRESILLFRKLSELTKTPDGEANSVGELISALLVFKHHGGQIVYSDKSVSGYVLILKDKDINNPNLVSFKKFLNDVTEAGLNWIGILGYNLHCVREVISSTYRYDGNGGLIPIE